MFAVRLLKNGRLGGAFNLVKSTGWSRCVATEAGGSDVRKIRLYKRVFSFGLFAGTLAVAYYFKKRRSAQFEEIFAGTSYLRNYDLGNLKLYTYKNYVLPEPVLKAFKDIKDFQFRDTDVIISSFPKTGTTWLQELVYLIVNDLDYEKAKAASLSDRFPYLEFPVPGISHIRQQSDPRLIKTHIPIPILLELNQDKKGEVISKPKMISILRNPKDVIVSYYYFSRMNTVINYEGDFSNFMDMFLRDKIPYGPLWKHYLDAITLAIDNSRYSHKSQILIISYENLKKDFDAEVDKICQFLGKEPLSGEQKKKLKEHCSFESMKDNPLVNYAHWDELGIRKPGESKFMRKGVIGDWKNHFSQDQNTRFDRWLYANFGDLMDFVYE